MSAVDPSSGHLASSARTRRVIALWLLVCSALVFVIVVVGGVTRLTRSGLSIVEWRPIAGILPPLSHDQWLEAFASYRHTPEYRQVNHGMSLAQFKDIFWWEYFHRLLGRLIGVAFLVPLLWFWAKRRIDGRFAARLGGIFVLGGLQGVLGWYMVQSGLVDDPRVSHYRLAAHLGLALLIFAMMFWIALDMLYPRRTGSDPLAQGTCRHSVGLVLLLFFMALSGALVAGTRAGLAYNTFPLMNGHVVPPEILYLRPWYANFFDNMATIQFVHRSLAWMLAVLTPWFWWRVIRGVADARARLAAHALLAMLAIQIALGIATLVLLVPVPLAAAHQAGAVMLLAAAINAAHSLRS